MKIQKVSPRHIDKSNARVVEVTTSKGTLITPCQIVNQNEYNAIALEEVKPPINQIQIQSSFDRTRLRKLRHNGPMLNGALANWKRRCGAFSFKSCIPILDGIAELSAEDLSFIVSMQFDAGMDLAYYPYESISAPRFSSKLDKLRNENPQDELVPVLDMGESSTIFKAKFLHLIDAGYPSVCMWYQGIMDSRSNLFFIKHKARDLEMWTILGNYYPKYSQKIPASFTHMLPWYGVDSYVKQVAEYPLYLLGEGEEELPQRPVESIRFIGKKTFGILDRDSFKKDNEILRGCPCEALHGGSIDTILSGGMERAARLSKIHNLIEGEKLIDDMKIPIRENGLSDFLKKKKYPSRAIQFNSLDDLSP